MGAVTLTKNSTGTIAVTFPDSTDFVAKIKIVPLPAVLSKEEVARLLSSEGKHQTQDGTNLRYIQELLGHAHSQMTEICKRYMINAAYERQ